MSWVTYISLNFLIGKRNNNDCLIRLLRIMWEKICENTCVACFTVLAMIGPPSHTLPRSSCFPGFQNTSAHLGSLFSAALCWPVLVRVGWAAARGDRVICPTLPYKPPEGTFFSWLEAVPPSGLRNVISSGKPPYIFPLDVFTAPSTSPLKQDSCNLGVISIKLTEGRKLSVLCTAYSAQHRTWHMAVGH